MLPLYSSSINARQPDSILDSAPLVFNVSSSIKSVVPDGRFVVSEGTQTYTGKDVNIQTSDELLVGKWKPKWHVIMESALLCLRHLYFKLR